MKIKMNKTKGIVFFILSLAVMAFAGYVILFGVGAVSYTHLDVYKRQN